MSIGKGHYAAPVQKTAEKEPKLKVAQDYTLDIDAVRVNLNDPEEADILQTNMIILTVTGDDARAEHKTLETLVQERAVLIKGALNQYREERKTKNLAINAVYALLLTAGLAFSFSLLKKVLVFVHRKAMYCGENICQYTFKIQKFELLSRWQVLNTIDLVLSTFGYIVKGFIVYFYLYILLNIFPITRPYASRLLDFVIAPLTTASEAFIESFPDFLTIAIIVLFSRYMLKLIRLFFAEVKKGTVEISGFYPEWCDPTYKIVRFLVLALTLISVFPYIPGSRSPVFQGSQSSKLRPGCKVRRIEGDDSD